ncbi:hypothetical protein [Paenibacillus sp. FSL L8-0494]|uniref:hypothetical protein n=1 Tax=Paenibacillus sp. FSL L8-0494 TaxID=2975352 RepID=UPI0030FAF35B
MSIHDYLDRLEGNSKRHILLIVTPKEKYPINFLDENYYSLENSILQTPKEYMSLYGDDPNEIMHYVAFREYLRPVISDKYSVAYQTTDKIKRSRKEEIISFIVAKHFYDNVPSGTKKEDAAISDGLILADDFLSKFPLNKFEHVLVKVGKNSDEANVLIDISFQNRNDDYYFDHVYIH